MPRRKSGKSNQTKHRPWFIGTYPKKGPVGAHWGRQPLHCDRACPSDRSPIGLAVVIDKWVVQERGKPARTEQRTYQLLCVVGRPGGPIIGYSEVRRVIISDCSQEQLMQMANIGQEESYLKTVVPARVRRTKRRRKLFVVKPTKVLRVQSANPRTGEVVLLIMTHHGGERAIVFKDVKAHNNNLLGVADGLNLRLKLPLVRGDGSKPPPGFEKLKSFQEMDGSKPVAA